MVASIMILELTAVVFSLASLHMPYSGQDQFNPGIHVEAGNVRAGFYRNSNACCNLPDTTTYVGYSIPLIVSETFRAGLNISLDIGYRSPVMGNMEFRVGEHVVIVAAPPIKYRGYEYPTIVGLLLRFPTSKLPQR
jgi:hypothetical protein